MSTPSDAELAATLLAATAAYASVMNRAAEFAATIYPYPPSDGPEFAALFQEIRALRQAMIGAARPGAVIAATAAFAGNSRRVQ